MKKFKPYYFVLNGTENILYFFENEKVSQCRKDASAFFGAVEMSLVWHQTIFRYQIFPPVDRFLVNRGMAGVIPERR